MIFLVLFVLLILVSFSVHPPPETEEGILVNFGTGDTGSGMIEPSPPTVQEETSPPLPSNAAIKTDEEPLLTQASEEAPEVKKIDPEARKKRLEKIEADRILKEQVEADNLVSNQPAGGKSLGVYVDRSYARPGERWISLE